MSAAGKHKCPVLSSCVTVSARWRCARNIFTVATCFPNPLDLFTYPTRKKPMVELYVQTESNLLNTEYHRIDLYLTEIRNVFFQGVGGTTQRSLLKPSQTTQVRQRSCLRCQPSQQKHSETCHLPEITELLTFLTTSMCQFFCCFENSLNIMTTGNL